MADEHMGNPSVLTMEIDDVSIPLNFDGRKTYIHVHKPTETEINELPHYELTSSLPWRPEEDIPLVRRAKLSKKVFDIKRWKALLGWQPDNIIQNTLSATTQYVSTVEAETRDVPRHHLKVCLPTLQPRHCHEGFYTDTFFADIRSLRGYTCVQLFVGSESLYTFVSLMKTKQHAYMALEDFICEVATPKWIYSDNAGEETGKCWTSILCKYCISGPSPNHTACTKTGLSDGFRMSNIFHAIY